MSDARASGGHETSETGVPGVASRPSNLCRPIYMLEMPSASWQLLWWLIAKMNEHAEVRDGWRIAAARELRKDRTWIQRCAQVLERNGLIETAPRKRYVRIVVSNING